MKYLAFALMALAATPAAAADKRSGLAFVSPQTRALQEDDFANPGMLWVSGGESLWDQSAGGARKSCTDCHNDARKSMRGVAARYPMFDQKTQKPIDLQGRINQCRSERQRATPLPFESEDLLSLSAYVAHQSRGMPVTPPRDARLSPFIKQGEAFYFQKIGQIDVSCSACHDQRAGQRLSGNLIPEAHPTGYPIYRLEWQNAGSLQRRLRGCMTAVRAEPYAYGSDEMIALELYLMVRASGLLIETPGVRP
jgi:sulfur-oxidizing protein SoxA